MTLKCRSLALHIAISLGLPGLMAASLHAEPPVRSTDVPVRVRLSRDLQRVAADMMQRSPTFRAQLERLARTEGLIVTAEFDPTIGHRSFRARSVIHRLRTGETVAVIGIASHGNPVEWLAHEFEHVLELVEGVDLPALARRSGAVWRTGDGDMFETERAIRAGQRVLGEMRGKRARQTFLSNRGVPEDEIVGASDLAP